MGQMCVEGNKNERWLGERSGRELMRGVLLWVVLPLIVASSGTLPPPGISRPPVNVSVAAGKRAEFICGRPKSRKEPLIFTLYGPHDNHSMTCYGGQMKENAKVPIGRYRGVCKDDQKDRLAVWSIFPTKLSDSDTYVKCQLNTQSFVAALTIYDSNNFAIIIGCTIGGFLTTLLFFGVIFRFIRGSERLQQCFRGPVAVEEDITMATME